MKPKRFGKITDDIGYSGHESMPYLAKDALAVDKTSVANKTQVVNEMPVVFLYNPQPRRIEVTSDTQYVILFDGKSEKNNKAENRAECISLDFILNKPEVSAEIIVLYILKKEEKLMFSITAEHRAPRTTSDIQIKGVLLDNSISDFKGKIIVQKEACQANAYLSDKVLVVGEKARNYSEPVLEIRTDDVRASHNAFTGRVDGSQVYYLMSRGLSREKAVEIITEGFTHELTARIKDTKTKEKIRTKLPF